MRSKWVCVCFPRGNLLQDKTKCSKIPVHVPIHPEHSEKDLLFQLFWNGFPGLMDQDPTNSFSTLVARGMKNNGNWTWTLVDVKAQATSTEPWSSQIDRTNRSPPWLQPPKKKETADHGGPVHPFPCRTNIQMTSTTQKTCQMRKPHQLASIDTPICRDLDLQIGDVSRLRSVSPRHQPPQTSTPHGATRPRDPRATPVGRVSAFPIQTVPSKVPGAGRLTLK